MEINLTTNIKFVFFLFLILSCSCFALTKLSGKIEQDKILRIKDSPYLIEGDLHILKGVLITVDPGVEFLISNKNKTRLKGKFFNTEERKNLILILVQGAFQLLGAEDKRISFKPQKPINKDFPQWGGLIFDRVDEKDNKVRYCDFSGALKAITVSNCSPIIRNSIFNHNRIAVHFVDGGNSDIHNCNFINNYITAILNSNAAPHIFSSIFYSNEISIWSDHTSKIKIEYNNFFNSRDLDFLKTPPEVGIITSVNRNKDSCDEFSNIFLNPIFFGSKSHEDSLDLDIKILTDKEIKSTSNDKLSRVIVQTIPDSLTKEFILKKPHIPWQLTKYSRLKDAGYPKSDYKDLDGTINDIGYTGCSEFNSK